MKNPSFVFRLGRWLCLIYPCGVVTVITPDLLDESQTKLSSDLLDSRQSVSQIQVHNEHVDDGWWKLCHYFVLYLYCQLLEFTVLMIYFNHVQIIIITDISKVFFAFLYFDELFFLLLLYNTDWFGQRRGKALGCGK